MQKKQQDNQNKPQNYKELKKSFYQYMKKDQNLPNKIIHSNNSSGKPLPNSSNHSRNQSPYNSNYRGRSPDQRNSRNSSQNRYSRSHSRNTQYRNNYSRSNSNRPNFFLITVPIHIQGIDTIQMKDQETHRTICIEISQTNETEAIQKIEITDIKIDREIIQTTDQINKDQQLLIITIIKLDHEKIHKKKEFKL